MELSKRFPANIISAHSGRTPEYAKLLTDARFCLVPRGLSPWTLRTYETFFAGCVPVIISDAVRLPFQEFVDYSRVSIKWPEALIDDSLVEYLRSIPASYWSTHSSRAHSSPRLTPPLPPASLHSRRCFKPDAVSMPHTANVRRVIFF